MKKKTIKIGKFYEGNVEFGEDEINSQNAKIRITMFMDVPVLKKAKDFSKLTGSKYQTLLNECLNNTLDNYLQQKLKEIKRGINEFEKKSA